MEYWISGDSDLKLSVVTFGGWAADGWKEMDFASITRAGVNFFAW